MRTCCTAALAIGLVVTSACTQDQPAKPTIPAAAPAAGATGSGFLRFIDQGDYTGQLQVAMVRYGDPARGIEVDLLSAVHVGEGSYYQDLMRRFASYDAVLYELVAPEGTVPDPDAEDRGFNPLSMLQKGMQRMLQLEFQLEAIDYQQKNLVHADLSAEDIVRLWKERGESLMSTLLKMMSGAAKVQQERYDAEAEKAEEAEKSGAEAKEPAKPRGRDEKQRALKWALAHEIGPMEEMLAMFGDDDKGSGSVLLGARNKRAVEVLQREIKAGKKKLAIFYGAAHMPDMARRIEKELGLKRISEDWVVAWNIQRAAAKADGDGKR